MKRISILGSTGSIGRQCLSVVDSLPGRFEVVALAAGANVALVAEQIARHHPKVVSVATEECRSQSSARHSRQAASTNQSKYCSAPKASSASPRIPTRKRSSPPRSASSACPPPTRPSSTGKNIALANKEVLVAAGEVVMAAVARHGVALLPVDSEHNADSSVPARRRPWRSKATRPHRVRRPVSQDARLPTCEQ